jgi:hypothetical protein
VVQLQAYLPQAAALAANHDQGTARVCAHERNCSREALPTQQADDSQRLLQTGFACAIKPRDLPLFSKQAPKVSGSWAAASASRNPLGSGTTGDAAVAPGLPAASMLSSSCREPRAAASGDCSGSTQHVHSQPLRYVRVATAGGITALHHLVLILAIGCLTLARTLFSCCRASLDTCGMPSPLAPRHCLSG